ncbi:class I SAM-dependent methyltransferase [Sphingomonas sp.]|uniref:class I SAM-dependent methyltransferase n=1 Tax=Sphingomonas sp. TaxID=28214 RepID=UPI002C4FFB1B|nr:class I SAM-dependent methyltransferase [Sphingomonas sp.]HTG39370.1 class I SAM-dependent methyltransferase [Sphingomonas sp.]
MDTVRPFTDRAAISTYAEDTPRRVPGYADLHRMTMLLLAERAPPVADILVYGAGGGLEIKALAEAQPGWRFVGIDPSAEMLDLARDVLRPLDNAATLIQGYIADAPQGPFDGATCLLTLHFLHREERLEVLHDIRRRLKPGAAFVIAHHSCPDGSDPRRWLARSVAFADRSAPDLAKASASAEMLMSRLPILSSDGEEALLRQAGFREITLFYAAFSFRGWVATA